MKIYNHWSLYPKTAWRWKDFTAREMACRGTGKLAIDEDAMDKLQALRDRLGRPVIVNSAFRSKEHNTAVGGAKASLHLKARAFDVRMDNHDPHEFRRAAEAVGFTGFGGYRKQGFMHIDTGRARAWGEWWPASHAHKLPEETPRPKARPVVKDKGVQATALAAGAAALRETAGLFDGLEQYAQITAIVLLFLAALLFSGKLKEMLS